MKKILGIAGLGLIMSASALSSAYADSEERWPRWYIGLSGGYTYMQDQDVSSASGANKISLNNGYGIGGSIGYLPSSSIPILNNMRFEGEITYHSNAIDKVNFNNGTSVSGTGSYTTTAYMINAFYDLPLSSSPWSPYIGAGLGVASVHLPTSNNIGNGDGDTNELAYQGLIGIGYTPISIPDTQWTLGYRYLGTSDPGFSGASSKYSTNSVEVGAKFRF